jgi:uncharacterized membrane protein YfcA
MILITLEVLTPDKVMRMAAGVIVFLTILSGVLLHFWEIDALHYLPGISLCPFHVITGMACPGCGMTRAFLTLGQLKLQEAIALNPFSVLLFSVMIVYLWLGKMNRVRPRK